MLIQYIRKISLCLLTLLLILSLNTTCSISAESTTTSSAESESGKTYIEKAYPILASAGNSTSNGIIPIHQWQITKTSNNTEITPIRSNSKSLGITPIHQWQTSPAKKNEVFSPCNSKSIGLIPKHQRQTLKTGSNGIESNISSSGDLTLVSDMLNNTSVSSEVYGLPNVTFTRSSIACRQDGTQVSTNLPRYNPSNFDQALMIEEGTNNLLSVNQSSMETNLDPAYVNDAEGDVITRDTNQAWHGSACLKVVTGTNPWGGVLLCNGEYGNGFPAIAGQTYTASAYLKGEAGGELVAIQAYDSDCTFIYDEYITLTTGWQRASVTFTVPAGKTCVYIIICKVNDAGIRTFYADGIQLEQKSYATSWQTGGTNNLLSANQSSIETSLDPAYVHDAEDDVITRDTNQAWHGSACIKVVTGTNPWGGVDLWNGEVGDGFPAIAGHTYTASAYLKGEAGGEQVAIQAYDSSWTFIDDEYITLTTDWQRASVTFTVPAGETYVYIIICKANDVGIRTFYADGIQLEQKSYATSWNIRGMNNLLSANQSSIETSLDPGYVNDAEGDVVTRDTNQAWHGSACLKVVTGTNPWGGALLCNGEYGNGFPVIAGQTYTASAFIKGGAGGEQVALQAYASDWTFIDDWYVTLTTDWRQVSCTFTVPAGKTSVLIIICKVDDTGIRTFYADDIQLEPIGDIPRTAETLTIPASEVLNAEQGSIEVSAYIDPGGVHSANNPNWSTIFSVAELQHSPNLKLNQISIRRSPYSTDWKIWFSNASGGTSAIDLGNITSAGWYSFAVTWQAGAGGYGYLNGVNKGSVEASYLPYEFTAPLANIGSWVESDCQFDHLIDDLRISSRLRTAAEIQTSYQSNQPLIADEDTTLKLSFNGNLEAEQWSGSGNPVLSAGSVTGQPGNVIQIPLTLNSLGEVGGISFELNFDPNLLTFQNATLTSISGFASDYSCVTSYNPGVVTVIFYSSNAALIPDGVQSLGTLSFSVATGAQTGQTCSLELQNVAIGDTWGDDTNPSIENGQFSVS